MKFSEMKEKYGRNVGWFLFVVLCAVVYWFFWQRPEAPKPEATTASKTVVADDATKFLTAPKAPEPIVVTQVIERVVEQTVVTTQVVERVVQTAPTTITQMMERAYDPYQHCEWIEERDGEEIGTITNDAGKIVKAKVHVTRTSYSKRGDGPNAPISSPVLSMKTAEAQVYATTPVVTRIIPSTPAVQVQAPVRQQLPADFYSNPFAKPRTGGEAFDIDPTISTRAKKR